MAQLEDEEEQHLATLHELEATREDIASYQGLLRDLPDIYERKFNERLKPVLDRQQHLIDEREQLLQRLQASLPSTGGESRKLLPPMPDPALPAEEAMAPQGQRWRQRPWWLLGVAALGLTVGLQLNKHTVSNAPTPASGSFPAGDRQQTRPVPSPLAAATNRRDRVIEAALAEWSLFGQPTLQDGRLQRLGRKEGDPGQWQRVITYWREGLQNRTVTDRADVTSLDHPWSAAFIAYVMKRAGAGDQFPYAASHSGSIKEAIYNRQNSIAKAKLIGQRVSDYAPLPGDLLCATRSWATGRVTYANAGRFDFFPSRCELVIRSSSSQIQAIGGDLFDAVTLHNIKAVDGKLAPEIAQDWLVIIQTRID
ncbi:MAG: DUF2272 domain-containing protein [Cyanobacteriota bacterium]|jgi:hypothetical protein